MRPLSGHTPSFLPVFDTLALQNIDALWDSSTDSLEGKLAFIRYIKIRSKLDHVQTNAIIRELKVPKEKTKAFNAVLVLWYFIRLRSNIHDLTKIAEFTNTWSNLVGSLRMADPQMVIQSSIAWVISKIK